MSETRETHLGDGLYASFDGWQIVLRAPRSEGDHYVALESEVVAALLEFIAGLTDTAVRSVLLSARAASSPPQVTP